MGRQVIARNSTLAREIWRAARPGDRQDRLCRYGDRVVATVRPPAAGRCDPRRHQVPDLAADPDRADLQQHGADRPARADPGADDAYARRGYGDRAGLAQRPHRAAMGRVPGGHCLGGLLTPYEAPRARSESFPDAAAIGNRYVLFMFSAILANFWIAPFVGSHNMLI